MSRGPDTQQVLTWSPATRPHLPGLGQASGTRHVTSTPKTATGPPRSAGSSEPLKYPLCRQKICSKLSSEYVRFSFSPQTALTRPSPLTSFTHRGEAPVPAHPSPPPISAVPTPFGPRTGFLPSVALTPCAHPDGLPGGFRWARPLRRGEELS